MLDHVFTAWSPLESSSETWSSEESPEKVPEKIWQPKSSRTKLEQRPGAILNAEIILGVRWAEGLSEMRLEIWA